LGGGLAATAGLLLTACSGQKALRIKVRSGAKVTRTDVPALNVLLDVEHYAIAAYAAGIPLLHKPQSDAAVQFLAQELAHTVQLSELIRRAGGKPNRPHASYDLGHPRSAEDVLALLKHLERAQLGAYLEAIPRLSGGPVRAAVASIFANEAQHLAMLRWQTGEAPAPAALVTAS
jgi:hypothetical protein